MALTESNMLPLGTQAPEFKLIDVVDERIKSLNQLKGDKGTIVVFMCNHCPYVVHLLDEFVSLAQKNIAHGIQTIAISSNDVENYPDDHPEKMKQLAFEKGFSFPYLYDEDQSIAKAYEAACTPDFYLLDQGECLTGLRKKLMNMVFKKRLESIGKTYLEGLMFI